LGISILTELPVMMMGPCDGFNRAVSAFFFPLSFAISFAPF
jgi:hypothetical protein